VVMMEEGRRWRRCLFLRGRRSGGEKDSVLIPT
jgi:hypothetical protein